MKKDPQRAKAALSGFRQTCIQSVEGGTGFPSDISWYPWSWRGHPQVGWSERIDIPFFHAPVAEAVSWCVHCKNRCVVS